MFKTLPKRLLSAIIAPPIAIIVLEILNYFTLTESEKIEIVMFDYSLFQFLYVAYVFYFPFYLVAGVPTSYIVDYISKKVPGKSPIWKYCLKLFLYIFMASAFFSLLFESPFAFHAFFIAPALIGFHLLFLIRKEYQPNYYHQKS